MGIREPYYVIKNKKVTCPGVTLDGLELYYDTKGKKNTDLHKDTLIDMSGNGRHGELHNFSYKNLSGYQEDSQLVFDDIDDTLTMPKLSDIDANNFTYQLNNNILAFTGDEVKTVKNGDIEIGGRNLILNSNVLGKGYGATGIAHELLGDSLQVKVTEGNGNWFTRFKNTTDFLIEPEDDGEQFTISFYVQEEVGFTGNPTLYIKAGYGYRQMTRRNSGVGRNVWSLTFSWRNPETPIHPHLGLSAVAGTFTINAIKLEKGNIATDWTPAPEDLIETTDLKGNILGDMEDIIDDHTRDEQSGTEVFTDKADDSLVRVEVDGKSYQHAGSGKNLFVPVRLEANYSTEENNKLINTIGSEIFYPIESPIGAYTASFSYQHNLNYAPIFMTFYYSDGSSDGDSHGYLDSTSQIGKEMTSSSVKKVVGVGYNAPTVIGIEWSKNPDPNMTRYGLALDTGVKTIGVSWDMGSNPSMIRSGGLI